MNNNQPETDEIEIDLLKIAELLLHRAKFIIAITLLVAIATFCVTYFFITPQYTATAMMYVNNSSFSVGNTSFSISSSELTAAQSLVDTYVVILKSRTTLEEIIQRNNLEYDYEELYDMIESEAVNSTEIFNVDVTSPDPQEAEMIANSITEILPDRITAIVDGSDVRIVDYAVIPSERTSPSFTINTVVGALIGLVIASAIVILRYLFDDQIHAEDYLTQTYPGIPLLAVVPDMMDSEGKGYYSADEPSRGSSGSERKKRQPESAKPAKAPRKKAPDEQQSADVPRRRVSEGQQEAAAPRRRAVGEQQSAEPPRARPREAASQQPARQAPPQRRPAAVSGAERPRPAKKD